MRRGYRVIFFTAHCSAFSRTIDGVIWLRWCRFLFGFFHFYFHRLILWHISGRNPDISVISGYRYMNAAIFHSNFFSSECPHILGGISSWKIHGRSIVIVIYGDNDTYTVQITGKSVLAIGEHKLCITSVAERRSILANFPSAAISAVQGFFSTASA